MTKSRRLNARDARSYPSTQSFESPENAGHRQARLEQVLLAEVQSLLRDEASDPALEGVQPISLKLSPDGAHARLGYVVETALHTESEVKRRTQPALERASAFLRARLASQLDLKRVPKLAFTFVGVVRPSEPAGEGGDEWLS